MVEPSVAGAQTPDAQALVVVFERDTTPRPRAALQAIDHAKLFLLSIVCLIEFGNFLAGVDHLGSNGARLLRTGAFISSPSFQKPMFMLCSYVLATRESRGRPHPIHRMPITSGSPQEECVQAFEATHCDSQ